MGAAAAASRLAPGAGGAAAGAGGAGGAWGRSATVTSLAAAATLAVGPCDEFGVADHRATNRAGDGALDRLAPATGVEMLWAGVPPPPSFSLAGLAEPAGNSAPAAPPGGGPTTGEPSARGGAGTTGKTEAATTSEGRHGRRSATSTVTKVTAHHAIAVADAVATSHVSIHTAGRLTRSVMAGTVADGF
ncbi:MAG TPA: hypothetical protein VGH66_18290 [Acidimicrobiales bacterium]